MERKLVFGGFCTALAALLIGGMVLGGCGTMSNSGGGGSSAAEDATVFSYSLDTYAAAGGEFTPLRSNTLYDELQWLAVQTACTGMYNMAQTGDFTQPDPQDYYKPNHIRSYLTKLSGGGTQNTMQYGICFNYAQAAYDDILKYQSHYEKLGMKKGGWYIAAAFESSRQIILFDPVSRDKATMTVNGVSVRENSRQNVQTHGGATKHAWLWVYGKDGTIYWIDPTWTDNAGYVVWGVVQNGREVEMNPSESLCMVKIDRNGAGYAEFSRGGENLNRGNYDQAIADYTQAIRLAPNNAGVYFNRALAYDKKMDYDRAIADYTQAIRLNPNYAAITYNNRGNVYDRKGDYDQAIADYTQAIRLDPNYVWAYYNRGVMYERKGAPDRAIAEYNQAIRLDPNYAWAYSSRGIAYNAKGDYDRAIVDFNQAIRLDPNSGWEYSGRGDAYSAKGMYDQAIEDYSRAVRLDPATQLYKDNLRAAQNAKAGSR